MSLRCSRSVMVMPPPIAGQGLDNLRLLQRSVLYIDGMIELLSMGWALLERDRGPGASATRRPRSGDLGDRGVGGGTPPRARRPGRRAHPVGPRVLQRPRCREPGGTSVLGPRQHRVHGSPAHHGPTAGPLRAARDRPAARPAGRTAGGHPACVPDRLHRVLGRDRRGGSSQPAHAVGAAGGRGQRRLVAHRRLHPGAHRRLPRNRRGTAARRGTGALRTGGGPVHRGIPDRDTLWEAAKLLRLPWEGVFVVVVVEAPGLAQEGLPDAEALLAGRGIGSAWLLHPESQTGVVSLRHPDTAALLLELLGRSVRARAGVSPIYHALGDTPRALHYARLVQSSLPPGTRAVGQFEETPLRVLAAAAPDAAGELARAVLGPVLDLPAQDRSTLLTTLRAWFDAGGSASETGRRIYC